MNLADWLQCELDKRKEEFKSSSQELKSGPKPGTIDWLLEESERKERLILENECEEKIQKVKMQKLSEEQINFQIERTLQEYIRKKESCGLGRSTINRIKNGIGKTSNTTIAKLMRALDVEPFTFGKGYSCFEHQSSSGFGECEVCKKDFLVFNVEIGSWGGLSKGELIKSEEPDIKLQNVGISLQTNKQFPPKFDGDYSSSLEFRLRASREKLQYIKLFICDNCLKKEKVKSVLVLDYPQQLKKILEDYPQYTLEKLAERLKINEITLIRISRGITNYVSSSIAFEFAKILMNEIPEYLRESAGVIQPNTFTNFKGSLFDEFFHDLCSLRFNFYYPGSSGSPYKLLQIEESNLKGEEIEAKYGVGFDERYKDISWYELDKLIFEDFSEFIGHKIPDKIPNNGRFPEFYESEYIYLEDWLNSTKRRFSNRPFHVRSLSMHFKIFRLFLVEVCEFLSIGGELVDEFFLTKYIGNVRNINEIGISTGIIILNQSKSLVLKEGVMQANKLDYVCPVTLKFCINPSSNYFAKRNICGGQTMVCFPIKKSQYDISADYHHMVNVFNATMLCLMDVETDEEGNEFISEYRHFAIKRDKSCNISVSIERIRSPFNREDLSWIG